MIRPGTGPHPLFHRSVASSRRHGGLALLFLMMPALAIPISCAPREAPKESAMSATGLPRAVRVQDERLVIETDRLAAEVTPNGYTTGVRADTFVDRATGARDGSFGLDIVDFLMGPGAEGGMPYEFGNKWHGNIAKHYLEGPQICTQAKHVDSEFLVGRDFVAVRQWWRWKEAAPGYAPGSLWEQWMVFPMGRRWFLSADRVESTNDFKDVFLRIDMPGHLKHNRGDTFEEAYLSYEGRLPAADFFEDFPPDARHLYQRGKQPMPERIIRARKIRGPGMPWLAGLTLDPSMVSEAWCHQRGYVCFIQEIGTGVKRGQSFSAANVIGYFDSVAEMEKEYDRLKGFASLAATKDYWLLAEGVILADGDNRFHVTPQGTRPAPKSWRVLAHGRGDAVINGRRVRIDGERVVDVPAL